ncbi:hypothetical protein DFH27DRAFT_192969 [Peziza echinospora]|nr:hypothetical protein DFH27DRAFT_192969 [Peziza echinospora]
MVQLARTSNVQLSTGNSELPSDLEKTTLRKFDELVASGEVLYTSSDPEPVRDFDGFKVQFRTAGKSYEKKPILDQNAPGRNHSTSTNPFENPDPAFIIARNDTHTLLVNKFCILRPQLLLHTNEFQRQDEALNQRDITSAWTVLKALDGSKDASKKVDKGRYMAFFNCGANAGSSQGHKHVQISQRPRKSEDFALFPDEVELSVDKVTKNLKNIPYTHFIHGLPSNATSEYIFQKYGELMSLIDPTIPRGADGVTPSHNVIIVPQWIMVIPRVNGRRGLAGANAAGMVGMIWVKNEEERDTWLDFGVVSHLQYLGSRNESYQQ